MSIVTFETPKQALCRASGSPASWLPTFQGSPGAPRLVTVLSLLSSERVLGVCITREGRADAEPAAKTWSAHR